VKFAEPSPARYFVCMSLTAEEQNNLLNNLRAKWTNSNCLRCNSNNWIVQGVVQQYLASTKDRGNGIGGEFLPTGVLICRTCGSTELVNLVVAGIVKGGQ